TASVFFFQAEDGIRDFHVTGVQTCALPISSFATVANDVFVVSRVDIDRPGPSYTVDTLTELQRLYGPETELYFITGADAMSQIQIGRASCRKRVEESEGGVAVNKKKVEE